MIGHDLEHAVTGAAHGVADGEELIGRDVGAGDQAVLRAMQDRARRGEADRAGAQRRFDDVGHLRDLVGRRFLVGAITEHVRAHGGVRHLRGDVHHARRGVERVEVLGERLPVPLDALVQRGAGDVFDAFHQLDEETSRHPGRTGANPTPQLPITTVVTPCQLDGVTSGSHVT